MPKPRVVVRREVLLAVLVGYGIALVLVLLAFVAVDGEAGQYLFKGGVYMAVVATGMLVASIRKRRD